MSKNTVTIDADRLLQWGIDAYERGRASVVAPEPAAGQQQTFQKIREERDLLKAENSRMSGILAAPIPPWPTLARCRVVLLGGGNTAQALFDTQWPGSGPADVSVILSNGASYRGRFT